MRAAVFTAYGESLKVTDVARPDPDTKGAIVETEACGICRSDWHAWTGERNWAGSELVPGQILGHEPAGRVVDVGDQVEDISVGDHVTVPFNIADGSCSQCRNGRGNLCEDGAMLGFDEAVPGAFAQEFQVPDADVNAIRLPEGVTSTDMACMGCRFMTAFRGLVHRAGIRAGDWVSIHGCGGVGLSAVHIADAVGANVVAVDLDGEKLSLARDLGASETVNVTETEDVPGAVSALTDGGVHVSVDALGIADTCRNSVFSLRKQGTHVQLGLTTEAERGEIPLPTDLMVGMELTFVGSKGMPPARYDEMLRMVSAGTLDPGRIISEKVSLEETSEILDAMTHFDTSGISVITEF